MKRAVSEPSSVATLKMHGLGGYHREPKVARSSAASTAYSGGVRSLCARQTPGGQASASFVARRSSVSRRGPGNSVPILTVRTGKWAKKIAAT
jgi:hypothetical protein